MGGDYAHIIALITLIMTFVIKWSIKYILLKLHAKGKIGTLLTVVLTMLVFMTTYTFLHTEAPSPEAVILMGIFVLELTRIED